MEFRRVANIFLHQKIFGRSVHHDAGSIFNGFIETTSAEASERFLHAQKLQKMISSLRHTFRMGGGKLAIESHTKRNGKMLVRDRISRLLDPDSPFYELAPLAGHQVYSEDVASAGIVSGVGVIHGQRCMILANDATVKGGTLYPLGVKKQLRALEIAMQNGLPCVHLVDSGGAFLPLQSELFADSNHGGRVFYNQAIMSSRGITQIAVVCGSCTAGAAYVPAMVDEAIIVRGIGTIFLAGPPLVRAATGEIVTAEDLGGAEVHCFQSGLTDHYAETEAAALEKARSLIESSNHSARTSAKWHCRDEPIPTLFDPQELLYIVPAPCPESEYQGIPMAKVLSRIVDGSCFVEFKSGYGTSIAAGFGSICGHPVGLVANMSPFLSAAGARKAAHFVALCTQRKVPIVFLQDVQGFDFADGEGIVLKEAAKLVRAVACANVPKITVTVGKAIGAASIAMCGRALNPSFSFMWPSATTMIATADEITSIMGPNSVHNESSALYAAARLWVDDIVSPPDTRAVIGHCLDVCRFSDFESKPADFGVIRM